MMGGAALLLATQARAAPLPRLAQALAKIEAESGGRLGVAVLDTGSGARLAHRGEERFALCSTVKLLIAGAILARADRGQEQLEAVVRFGAGDLLEWSPVTKPAAGGAGLSVAALCRATMILSDNTAANLLLARLGGPQAVTAMARALGDTVTRLDRLEPELNEAVPGDPRDTTSPAAMLHSLQALALGEALAPASRALLLEWLVANRTGDNTLRAGLPASWRAGDKTGAGSRGTRNDVGIFWPPGRPPVLVSAYLTGTTASRSAQDATLAAVGRAVVAALA